MTNLRISYAGNSFLLFLLLCISFGVTTPSPVNATVQTNTPEEDIAVRPSDFHLKNVKTILLGQVNETRPAPDHSVPCVLENSSIANSSKTGDRLPCLNYETLWENDTLTLTLVGIERIQGQHSSSNFQAENISFIVDEPEGFFQNKTSPSNETQRRFRRKILGKDTRVQVPLKLHRTLPYSAVVRISTGCTGTLITSNHVLTSAHCVHNGKRYEDIKTLKVGLLKKTGKMRWFPVEYVRVPSGWTSNPDTVNFDYALVKLAKDHRRRHLEVATVVSSNSLPHESVKIQFISFPGDKEKNTMWYSYCPSYLHDEFILNKCDSYGGSSGSGIYFKNKDGKRFVSGVFSGSPSKRYLFRNKYQRFNIATRITPLKLLQIQNWALMKV